MGLELRDLVVARGGVPVLAGVSFSVTPGHALVLRGPNGSGKTTLLRTIAGLQPALSGEILGGDETIAYTAHSDGLKAMLSVRENLAFWAELFGHAGDAERAMVAFDLEPLADRYAGQLSAGQKRRLGLARMLVTGRPIWVMDEPTVSLDAGSVAQFAAVVGAHLQGGGSAILATHIDLGLPQAEVLDVGAFRASADTRLGASDEAFL